jgi:Holliday junction resolvase-like predicted endonuclease
VQKLVTQIKSDYDDVSTHFRLSKKKRLVGEIDVIAKKGDELHLFEVKCSYRISKARRQLEKFKRILKAHNATCFFYCGAGDMLVEVC